MSVNFHSAVVFDMDGTLLDTETIALRAFLEACESLNLSGHHDAYYQCVGSTSVRIQEILTAAFGHQVPYEEFYTRWVQRFDAVVADNPIRIKDGAPEILQLIADAGVPLAVATSTSRKSALAKLASTGLLDVFEVVVGGDDVSRGKPDPEIYLTAADRLGVAASECLAIEDSDNGVRAAHSAGMTVIHVPDLKPPSAEISQLGVSTHSSLWEIHRDLTNGTVRLQGRAR